MGRARDLRLLGDQQKIMKLAAGCPYLRIKPIKGQPPTAYQLEFKLKGYINKNAQVAGFHKVRLVFPEQYPFFAPPKFSFLGRGLFHPNVYRNGEVCHGWYLNNWNPAIHIDDLILDIARIISFKTNSYNLKSPANYACDMEWIEAHEIPVDTTDLEKYLGKAANSVKIRQPQSLNKRHFSPNTPSVQPSNNNPIKIRKPSEGRFFRNPFTKDNVSNPGPNTNNLPPNRGNNEPLKIKIIKKR